MGNTPKLLYEPQDKRFACECGARITDGGVAIEHAMHGHQLAQEEFRNGAWRFVHTLGKHTLMEMMVERLRLKGESVPSLIRRINEEAEAVRLKVEQLEHDKVNG